MKIESVSHNNRTRSFRIATRSREFEYPYASVEPRPTRDDPIHHVFPDPELGREGFTYVLRSGAEGTVHLDHVRAQNQDPALIEEEILYRLTLEAQRAIAESAMGKRMLTRLLGTSLSQLARLLDQTNTSKSIPQMIALLRLLDRDVEIEVVRALRTSQAGSPP